MICIKDQRMETSTRKPRTVVELEELRNRLREAEETLAAIRNGEVDSLVVSGPEGDKIFSLKGADQPYRVFVEQMQEGALALTPDGAILYANQRFADMLKLRLEKVIGSKIQTFFRAADQSELSALLAHDGARTARHVLCVGDGSLIPVQLSFNQLPIDEVDGISLVVTDLTEQEEKRELATALSNLRLAQEQLQLQNEELKAARAAGDAANHAKDNFLAALSHELRTPLTPVLMTAASLMADESLPENVRRDLRMLRRNVELEARLIDDLLDLTRIVHGKVDLQPEVTDVHAIVDAAIAVARDEIAPKNLQMHRELHARDFHVNGDAVRIQQMLWNLVRNAVKFTPPGGGITVRSENADDGTLRISISDTGIGIPADAIEKIFRPFEQADRSVTQQFGGLGLGLAISKRLAEMHGGTITAESDGLNKGATFTLVLSTVPPPSAQSCAARSAVAAVAPLGKRLRILLVEDHEDSRMSIAMLLKRSHEVYDAGSVQAALRVASERTLDLVISDLGLPDGSGLDLMSKLRSQYGLIGICLTGYGMEDDMARSGAAGFLKHITKPVDLRKLEMAIADLNR
jgi:PAS domain S-box-containing protein